MREFSEFVFLMTLKIILPQNFAFRAGVNGKNNKFPNNKPDCDR